MQSINLTILIPIGLILLQSFVLLSLAFLLFRKLKILPYPIAGMEYSSVISAACLCLGIMIISMSDVNALFQSFKVFANQDTNVFRNTFSKFSQFFLVILLAELLFLLLSYLVVRIIFGFVRPMAEIEKGNVPAAVIFGSIMISFAIILKVIGSETIEFLIPQYVNIL